MKQPEPNSRRLEVPRDKRGSHSFLKDVLRDVLVQERDSGFRGVLTLLPYIVTEAHEWCA